MYHAAARSWAAISMAWLAEIAKPMFSAVTLLELVAPPSSYRSARPDEQSPLHRGDGDGCCISNNMSIGEDLTICRQHDPRACRFAAIGALTLTDGRSRDGGRCPESRAREVAADGGERVQGVSFEE